MTSTSALAYRIVQLALALEAAERDKNDSRMAEALSKLVEAARQLREAQARSTW